MAKIEGRPRPDHRASKCGSEILDSVYRMKARYESSFGVGERHSPQSLVHDPVPQVIKGRSPLGLFRRAEETARLNTRSRLCNGNAVKFLQPLLKAVHSATRGHIGIDLLRRLALVAEALDNQNGHKALKGRLCVEDGQRVFIPFEPSYGGEYQLVKKLKVVRRRDERGEETEGVCRNAQQSPPVGQRGSRRTEAQAWWAI
jgi:hypothetical protein